MKGLPLEIRILRPPAGSAPEPNAASPAVALTSAFLDTVRILLRPFNAWEWLKLSLLCLLLGGGTASVAFNWELGPLSSLVKAKPGLVDAQVFLARHMWLIMLIVSLAFAAGIVLLYLRTIFRFILVDGIVASSVSFRRAWKENGALGESYFFWLLATLVAFGGAMALWAIFAFPNFVAEAASTPSMPSSVTMTMGLVILAVVGSLVALAIMLTDDLAVPLMYAERIGLAAAWRSLWRKMRSAPEAYAIYVLIRLAVSLGVGALVLFFIFPALLAVFSGVYALSAIGKFALGFLGLHGVWSPATAFAAGLALLLFTGLLFIVLSIAGMPGQVFIQDYGMRFLASHCTSVAALWKTAGEADVNRGDTIALS